MRWVMTLDLQDIYREGAPVVKLAGEVAERLGKLKISEADLKKFGYDRTSFEVDLATVVEGFADQSKQEDPSVEEFDDNMSMLYDWADQKSADRKSGLCWVRTTK